jgi:hypothetical protein
MHRLHFKYDYQAAILENQLRAITPDIRDWVDEGEAWFCRENV